jgi:hypothetical protein
VIKRSITWLILFVELEIRKLFKVMELSFNLQFPTQVISKIKSLPSKILSWYGKDKSSLYIHRSGNSQCLRSVYEIDFSIDSATVLYYHILFEHRRQFDVSLTPVTDPKFVPYRYHDNLDVVHNGNFPIQFRNLVPYSAVWQVP